MGGCGARRGGGVDELSVTQITLTCLAVSTDMVSYRTLALVTTERVDTGKLARVCTVGYTLIQIWWKAKRKQIYQSVNQASKQANKKETVTNGD